MSTDITGVILYQTEIEQVKKTLQSLAWCTNRIILVDGSVVDEKVRVISAREQSKKERKEFSSYLKTT